MHQWLYYCLRFQNICQEAPHICEWSPGSVVHCPRRRPRCRSRDWRTSCTLSSDPATRWRKTSWLSWSRLILSALEWSSSLLCPTNNVITSFQTCVLQTGYASNHFWSLSFPCLLNNNKKWIMVRVVLLSRMRSDSSWKSLHLRSEVIMIMKW